MTENRFYNYDDAMDGIRKHLALVPDGTAYDLSLLITDGSKGAETLDAKLYADTATWLKNNENIRRVTSRVAAVQEKYDVHIYEREHLGRLTPTVVIDHLNTSTASAVLYVLRDTLMRLSGAYGNGMGSVHLFIVEASRL